MSKKPPFEQLYYDKDTIVWGQGNKLFGPTLLARIKLPVSEEVQKQADEHELKDFNAAKEIYNSYVNKGVVFTSAGKEATDNTAVITSVNYDKQYICFNASKRQKEKNLQMFKESTYMDKIPTGPKGKFSINAFVNMVKNKQISIVSISDI